MPCRGCSQALLGILWRMLKKLPWEALKTLRISGALSPHHYAILLSPQSCLNKELGQLQSHFANKRTQDCCYWTFRNLLFFTHGGFERISTPWNGHFSSCFKLTKDLLGITWTMSSLAWLFLRSVLFLSFSSIPSSPFFSFSSLPHSYWGMTHSQRRLHPLSHPCYIPSTTLWAYSFQPVLFL